MNTAFAARQVLRFVPGESVVFNTKARCPLMLFLETTQALLLLFSCTVHVALIPFARVERPRGMIPFARVERPRGTDPPRASGASTWH